MQKSPFSTLLLVLAGVLLVSAFTNTTSTKTNYELSVINNGCDTPVNLLSPNSMSSQSSTQNNLGPWMAHDGDVSGTFNNYTLTNWEQTPWWEADLGNLNHINEINIWNRDDGSSPEQLFEFYVLVSDAPFTSVDLQTTLDQPGVNAFFSQKQACTPTPIPINLNGRYIRIQIDGYRFLSLAEVEVMGCDLSQCPPANTPCDDGHDYTQNDMNDGNCNCIGVQNFTPECTNNNELCLTSCPTNITVEISCEESSVYGDCRGTYVNWLPPTATSGCSNPSEITIENLSYVDPTTTSAYFPVGTTTLQYRITDDCCNVLYCVFSITIETTSTITLENCISDITEYASPGETGKIVSWNEDQITSITDCTCQCPSQGCTTYRVAQPGLTNGDFFPLGTTQVSYRIHNGGGDGYCNDEVFCSFLVTVLEEGLLTNDDGEAGFRGGDEEIEGGGHGEGEGEGEGEGGNDDETETDADCTDPPIVNQETTTGIIISPSENLGPTSSYIIATHRNHVKSDFGLTTSMCSSNMNPEQYRQAIINGYGEITPAFGEGEKKKLYRFGGTSIDGLQSGIYGITGWHLSCHADPSLEFAPYPYDDFGNYIAEANELQADMLVTVNYGSGTAQEAAAVVDFLHTHPDIDDDVNIIYEIGNEINWKEMNGWEDCLNVTTFEFCNPNNTQSVTVNHNPCTPGAYGTGVAEFIQGMREATDKTIKIGAVASIAGEWGGDWGIERTIPGMTEMFKQLLIPMRDRTNNTNGEVDCFADYFILHNYPTAPLAPYTEGDGGVSNLSHDDFAQIVMAQNTWEINVLETIVKPALQAAISDLNLQLNKEITFGNTEYYSHVIGTYRESISNSVMDALYTADNMITALDQNFEMAVNAALFTKPNQICDDLSNPNSLQNNSINLFFDACDPENHRFPVYYVHKEVAERLGSIKIPSIGFNLPSTQVDHYNDNGYTLMEDIGYYATKKDDGTIVLLVVNRTQFDTEAITIDPGMEFSTANMYSLVGETYNGDVFSIEEKSTSDPSQLLDLNGVIFRPASVSFIEIIPCSPTCVDEIIIDGNIHTETGLNVAEAEIQGCNTTGTDGNYECTGIISGSNVEIIPLKNIYPENGLDSDDLTTIQQHILGIQLLDSPYKVIAADANGDGMIKASDINAINYVLLGFRDHFPNNVPSWRFVPSAHVFPDPFYWPNQDDFPESIILDQVTTCETHDFVGIKVGDVNDSVNPLMRIAPSPEEEMTIQVTDRSLKAGETVEIPLRAKGFTDRTSYMFNLNINSEFFEVISWNAADLQDFSKESFAHSGDVLRTVWWNKSSSLGVSLEDGESLFTLVLKAKQNINSLKGLIDLHNEGKGCKIYGRSGIPYQIHFELQPKPIGDATIIVYPNPFTDKLDIAYTTTFTDGRIELFNTDGSLINQYNGASNFA